TNFTSRVNNNSLTGALTLISEDRVLANTASTAATFSTSNSSAVGYTAWMVGFRAATSGGAVSDTNTKALLTLSRIGALKLQNVENSTSAFQVQNASSDAIFNVDTTNQRVGVNTSSPSYDFQVNSGTLTTGTVSNSSSSANVTGSGTSFTFLFAVGDTFTI